MIRQSGLVTMEGASNCIDSDCYIIYNYSKMIRQSGLVHVTMEGAWNCIDSDC